MSHLFPAGTLTGTGRKISLRSCPTLPSLLLPVSAKKKKKNKKKDLSFRSLPRIGSCNEVWESKYLTFPNNHHRVVISWQPITSTLEVPQLFTKRRDNVDGQSRREKSDRWPHSWFSGSPQEFSLLMVHPQLLQLW